MTQAMTPERRREIERAIANGPTMEGEYERELLIELLTELDRLQAELRELRAEIHSGHILIPFDERYHQSLRRERSRASSDRLGWLICTRDGCGYEVPSHGWCFHHRVLDACWAYTKREEKTVDEPLRES